MSTAAQSHTATAVEELVFLRRAVDEWAQKARESVLSFQRQDGSFWKDSRAYNKARLEYSNPESEAPNLTSTARSYIALTAADRSVSKGDGKWIDRFPQFFEHPLLHLRKSGIFEVANASEPLNNFDVAHLADFVHTADYLRRYYDQDINPVRKMFDSGKRIDEPGIRRQLFDSLKRSLRSSRCGEVFFENGEPESQHYFATLHSLRAISILDRGKKFKTSEEKLVGEVAGAAKGFCIQQCFYVQRSAPHKQDSVRLAFAACIYALYEPQIDKDLCVAMIDALAKAQEENGSWPATHPVFRKKMQPWHIASHEVALCLTWLYFEPKLPDAARPVLLQMLQRYFLGSVIPTYIVSRLPGKTFSGWQDDHTVATDIAVGWATAIVCHFLANFLEVLNDWVNRKIIEDLRLQQTAYNYLIDDTTHNRSRLWRGELAQAVWPDLPPYTWEQIAPAGATDQTVKNMRAAWTRRRVKEIRDAWSDPSDHAQHTDDIVVKVLCEIFRTPGERPNRRRCAGLLPGKPGTRKTTFVTKLSEILKWPMVVVPASLIFERGFDLMEAQANHVFQSLRHLRRCVIFFDEFEEFFLRRDGSDAVEAQDMTADASAPVAVPHGRTIADFTTSAMLPRLQELHDAGRCLIFLATNHAERIDSAIKRTGRFDFQIEINHPNPARCRQYLKAPTKRTLEDVNLLHVNDALYKKASRAVSRALESFNRKDEIPFSGLEAALKEAVRSYRSGGNIEDATKTAISSITSSRAVLISEDPPNLEVL